MSQAVRFRTVEPHRPRESPVSGLAGVASLRRASDRPLAIAEPMQTVAIGPKSLDPLSRWKGPVSQGLYGRC